MGLITISQSIGSMGMLIAHQVGKTLDLDIYDDEKNQTNANPDQSRDINILI